MLLLDEPDNHLDFAGKTWLEGYIREHRGAVAIISHDRYFIDRSANRIFELEHGRVEGYSGNYAAYVAENAPDWSGMHSCASCRSGSSAS